MINHTKRQKSGHYTVKCAGVIKPGLYNTAEAALMACEYSDDKIKEIMDKHGAIISENMLKDVK